MSGITILLIAAAAFVLAYVVYGRWLANKWGINPEQPTPAHTQRDGVDYVPANKSVLFGHQFASIAGAGPINGPIIAAMFGWVPVMLWVIFGGIFIGAVHDFAAMYASVKSKGKSIGYIIELYVGKTGKQLFTVFSWLFSILVIAAFADIVAVTFNGIGADGALQAANGSVATTSILFIIAAIILGVYLNKKRPNGWASGAVAMVFLVACIVMGMENPIFISRDIWLYIVFAYIFIASVTPVWILLQPRDYLNSFLLVIMIVAAFVGVLCAAPTVNIPAFNGFEVKGMPMFPVLFVTVACGAVSGFHSLVSSGTSSKQINNERDMLPISYGSMLLESFVAIISLIAVGALAAADGTLPTGSPPVIFARAISGFLATVGLPEATVYTLMTLAISAFALTSLDSVARIGRIAFQEFFMSDEGTGNEISKFFSNRYVATAATLGMGYMLAKIGYLNIWPLFGSANQLLAALALIACAVFLKHTKRSGWMLYVPTLFMLGVTFTMLVIQIMNLVNKYNGGKFTLTGDGLQLVFAVLLLLLGMLVARSASRRLLAK